MKESNQEKEEKTKIQKEWPFKQIDIVHIRGISMGLPWHHVHAIVLNLHCLTVHIFSKQIPNSRGS